MEKTEKKYIKRAQKDYSISFKLSVVQEYETAKVSLAFLQRKYRIITNNLYTNYRLNNQNYRLSYPKKVDLFNK